MSGTRTRRMRKQKTETQQVTVRYTKKDEKKKAQEKGIEKCESGVIGSKKNNEGNRKRV